MIASNIFPNPFCFSFPSGSPILQILMHLMLSQRYLRLSSFLFVLSSLFCSVAVILTTLFSTSLTYTSASVILY